jgi:hypothetical protein
VGPVTRAVWVEQVVVVAAVAAVAVVYCPVEQVVVAVVARQSCVLPQELSRRRRADERTIVLCAEA